MIGTLADVGQPCSQRRSFLSHISRSIWPQFVRLGTTDSEVGQRIFRPCQPSVFFSDATDNCQGCGPSSSQTALAFLAASCQLPGTHSTTCSRGPGQCLPVGIARQSNILRAALPRRCGSSLPNYSACGSGGGSHGHVAWPKVAARILISSYGMDTPRTQTDSAVANRGRYEETLRCIC